MNFIAIDPGVNRHAYAVFHSDLLVAAGAIPVGKTQNFVQLYSCVGYDTVYVECQETRGKFSSVREKDIIQLASATGVLVGLCTARGWDTRTVAPREWTKGVPKKVRQNRMLEDIGVVDYVLLRSATLSLAPKSRGIDHNIFDAYLLGVWVMQNVKNN